MEDVGCLSGRDILVQGSSAQPKVWQKHINVEDLQADNLRVYMEFVKRPDDFTKFYTDPWVEKWEREGP